MGTGVRPHNIVHRVHTPKLKGLYTFAEVIFLNFDTLHFNFFKTTKVDVTFSINTELPLFY